MERAELERLDRNALIATAETLGVTRANILTRPELVDEVLVRTAKKSDLPRARGFFGRARDLVARVIEKGLHLPDAADRLRQVSVTASTGPSSLTGRVAPAVVPTVTLAEIYAAQGHRTRAIDTLRRVIELEPEHGAASSLLVKLEASPASVPPAVPLPPEDDDAESLAPASLAGVVPVGDPSAVATIEVVPATVSAAGETGAFLDDDPLPGRYDVDECVAIAVDPVTIYIYWEVREATLQHLRRSEPSGTLAVRLLVILPTWDGPQTTTRDFDVDAPLADRVVRDLPPRAVVRAAIGYRVGGTFTPIAHAPALETPPGAPCPVRADAFIRWTRTGLAPITPRDRDYAAIGRALDQMSPRREDLRPYERVVAPPGSSDLSAGFTAPSSTAPAVGPVEVRPKSAGAASSESLL